MKAKVMKIDTRRSYQGGIFYYVFFKAEDGTSWQTCLYPSYGNFINWKSVIERWESLKYSIGELWLDGLKPREKTKKKEFDADFKPRILKDEEA